MTELIQIALGGLLQGCVYALLAVGFGLVYRVTGVINLAQGGFCILGALLTYSLREQWGWPLALAATGGVLGTTLVGAALGAVAFVPGMRRVSNSNMLMLTAGLLAVLGGGMLVGWGSQPYALPPFSGDRPVSHRRDPGSHRRISGCSAPRSAGRLPCGSCCSAPASAAPCAPAPKTRPRRA